MSNLTTFKPLPSASAVSDSDLELKIAIARGQDLAALVGKEVYIVPQWNPKTRTLDLVTSPHEHLVEGCVRILPDGSAEMLRTGKIQ